jgi:hypothetical protein
MAGQRNDALLGQLRIAQFGHAAMAARSKREVVR